MILALITAKVFFLLLAVGYSVPVIIGGALHKASISEAQSWLFAIGWVGFITLQWLI